MHYITKKHCVTIETKYWIIRTQYPVGYSGNEISVTTSYSEHDTMTAHHFRFRACHYRKEVRLNSKKCR